MHRDNHGRRLPPFTNVPSQQEVEAYNPRNDGEACTDADFRPDLRSLPGTQWNKSVTAVFVRSFVGVDHFIYEDEEDICQGFVAHFKNLRNKFNNVNLEPTEETRMKRQRNRAERKHNVSFPNTFHIRLVSNRHESCFTVDWMWRGVIPSFTNMWGC